MAEHEGWSYLGSDNMEEFSERTSEEGWASQNSDGNGSFYGDDGSWGFRKADRSGSFYGEGDDWGHWNPNNGKTYYGDSDDDTNSYSDSNSGDFEVADAVGATIGAGLFAAAVNRSKRREEEERIRQEKAAKRAEWRKSPAGRKARKVKLIAIIALIIALAIALLVSSLKVIGYPSSEMIGSEHGEVTAHPFEIRP